MQMEEYRLKIQETDHCLRSLEQERSRLEGEKEARIKELERAAKEKEALRCKFRETLEEEGFRTKRHISKAFWMKRAKQGCRKSTMITVRDALSKEPARYVAESAGRKDGAGYNRNERTEAFHGR